MARAPQETVARLKFTPHTELTSHHLFRMSPTSHPASLTSLCTAAPHQAATGGDRPLKGGLLTVREVAQLLRVPVSWVYGRTRKRALNRLPGYRLGKYWRFSQDEVFAWVKSNGGGSRAT